MEKIRGFISGFLYAGGVVTIMAYLNEFGFVNPIYVDLKAHIEIFIIPIIVGIFMGWMNAKES